MSVMEQLARGVGALTVRVAPLGVLPFVNADGETKVDPCAEHKCRQGHHHDDAEEARDCDAAEEGAEHCVHCGHTRSNHFGADLSCDVENVNDASKPKHTERGRPR